MTPDSKSRTVEEIRDTLQDALESASEAGYWLKAGIEDMRKEELRDRDEFANIVRDGIDELARLRKDVKRKDAALKEIHERCRNCRCGYSPCGCGSFAEDTAFAALQPQPEEKKT